MTPPRTTVARLRWHRGLTQRELAELTRLSVKTIEKIEAGQSKGSPRTAILLASALAVDVEVVVNALLLDYKGRKSNVDNGNNVVNLPEPGANGEQDGEVESVIPTAAEA